MTDSFVTQCPHCQTRFRVTHHQLSVARGVVRCGQCMEVFNAARQLLEQSQASADAAQGLPLEPEAPVAEPQPPGHELKAAEPLPTEPEPQRAEPLPVEPVAQPVDPFSLQPGSPLAAPPPVQAAPGLQPRSPDDWSHTAQALDELDLDHELARLERRNQPLPRQIEAREESLQARRHDQHDDDHDDTPFGAARDDHPEPESLPEAAPLLVEQAPETAPAQPDPARTEPTLGRASDLDDDTEPTLGRSSHLDDDTEAALGRSNDLDDDTEPTLGRAKGSDDAPLRASPRQIDSDLDDPTHDDPRLEPVLTGAAPRTRKEPLIDVVDDPLQLDWQKPPVNWARRLMWMALVLLAAGLLAFQYVWFHFDEMARQDRYRPLFQQLCPTFGCKVPTRVDIGRIKSSNLVVRSHPDFKGALIVDAIIYNRAPFSQPFPLLELRFADLNGQLIASRRFKPAEYLSGELAGRGEMPSQTPIHIALDILDPGPRAVNYSLSFRSPD